MAVVISMPGHAVDGRVVHLRHEGEAAGRHAGDVVEALDDVQLPQRPIEVEGPRHEASHLDAELAPVAGRRQGDVADVELQIEVGILDPVRVVEVERDADESLTEHAGLVEPLVDVIEDALERDGAAGRGRRVVDRDAPARHVRARRLGIEERGVHPGELLHVTTTPVVEMTRPDWSPAQSSLPRRRAQGLIGTSGTICHQVVVNAERWLGVCSS